MTVMPRVAFFVVGVLLLLGCVLMAALAPSLQYEMAAEDRPVALFVRLYMLVGFAYLAMLPLLRNMGGGWGLVLAMVAVGLLMRLATVGTAPILEDDYHRYLWDGAVVAEGLNPYAHAPEQVSAGGAELPQGLRSLAEDEAGRATLADIDHGQYTTIYPPVAQLGFAAAARVQPFNIEAWRGIVLLCELAVLGVLLLALSRLGLPLAMAAIYWWCPLIVIELTQRLHMDALLMPLLVGAIALGAGGVGGAGAWWRTASAALGLAAGVKLWPVVLAPLLLRRAQWGWGRLLTGCAIAAGLAGVMLVPLLMSRGGAESAGVIAYASHWYNNSALYLTLHYLLQPIAMATGIEPEHAHYLARPMLAMAFLFVLAVLVRTPATSAGQMLGRVVTAIAALFVLSPAQFPWYFAWVVGPAALAFAAVGGRHRPLVGALLLYVVTLPLYYLTAERPGLVFAVHLPPTLAVLLTFLWTQQSPTLDDDPPPTPTPRLPRSS